MKQNNITLGRKAYLFVGGCLAFSRRSPGLDAALLERRLGLTGLVPHLLERHRCLLVNSGHNAEGVVIVRFARQVSLVVLSPDNCTRLFFAVNRSIAIYT